MKWLGLILVGALLLSGWFPRAAHAATRTVCVELALRDQRTDCPLSGAGVRRVCRSDAPGKDDVGWVHPVGLEIEFWDKDGTPETDDYIGTWRHQNGRTCITFEWENASYSGGEDNPDVYVKIKNRVLYAGSNAILRIVEDDGTDYPFPSSRAGWGGNPNAGTAVDCGVGAQCHITPGTATYIEPDPATDYAQALMALDSAQRILPVYYTQLDAGVIDIEYPSSEAPANSADALTLNLVRIAPDNASRGTLPTHELGHIVQATQFGVDPLDIIPDYGADGGWTSITTEFDSAATTEGWANYVAAVAWWDPANSNSLPFVNTRAVETAAPWQQAQCADNRGLPLQVAKAFWDLDDANNEAPVAPAAYEDNSNLETLDISAAWGNFQPGTANRQYNEIGVHRVNVWDYHVNSGIVSNLYLFHNCIQSQQY